MRIQSFFIREDEPTHTGHGGSHRKVWKMGKGMPALSHLCSVKSSCNTIILSALLWSSTRRRAFRAHQSVFQTSRVHYSSKREARGLGNAVTSCYGPLGSITCKRGKLRSDYLIYSETGCGLLFFFLMNAVFMVNALWFHTINVVFKGNFSKQRILDTNNSACMRAYVCMYVYIVCTVHVLYVCMRVCAWVGIWVHVHVIPHMVKNILVQTL